MDRSVAGGVGICNHQRPRDEVFGMEGAVVACKPLRPPRPCLPSKRVHVKLKCYPPPPLLDKLRPCPSYSIVVDTGGGFIFVSEVPVSSTQFLLRVGRAT